MPDLYPIPFGFWHKILEEWYLILFIWHFECWRGRRASRPGTVRRGCGDIRGRAGSSEHHGTPAGPPLCHQECCGVWHDFPCHPSVTSHMPPALSSLGHTSTPLRREAWHINSLDPSHFPRACKPLTEFPLRRWNNGGAGDCPPFWQWKMNAWGLTSWS